MSLMTLVGFFTSLFNIANWLDNPIAHLCLLIDGIFYDLLAKSYRIFQIICTINFNSLYGIISPLLNRIQALVMVFVVYKVGVALIGYMLKPESAAKEGSKILVNIFITAALLISYNFIFTVLNEISMLIIGTPDGYSYIALGQIAGVSGSEDSGLINRLVFGTNEQIKDVGNYLAYSTAAIFVTDANDETSSSVLAKEICNDGVCDFYKMKNLSDKVDKTIKYHYFIGFACCLFMIYSILKASIQIGVRMFKMLVLQILAPIAIITIIGDGTKSKIFQNFIKKYLSTYVEAFTRIFSLLLVTTFVCKFFINIDDFFGSLSQENWFTTMLVTIIIIIAAYKFATDIPKFIDEILGTHLSTGSDKNFIGGLLGAGIGLAAGFAGGLAGGGLGGAIAGAGQGLVGGIKSGSKGNNVAEFFKGQHDIRNKARSGGQNIAARGGLGNIMLGGIQTGFGVGTRQDNALAALDRRSKALDEYDSALNMAIKDEKADFLDGVSNPDINFSGYTDGYKDIKFGDNKDAYAAKMLEFDKEYQQAKARYETTKSASDLEKLQTEKHKAEEKAKKNFDAARTAVNDGKGAYAKHVEAKRNDYAAAGGKTDMVPKDIKSEKADITIKRNEVMDRASYSRTHGEKPKGK